MTQHQFQSYQAFQKYLIVDSPLSSPHDPTLVPFVQKKLSSIPNLLEFVGGVGLRPCILCFS